MNRRMRYFFCILFILLTEHISAVPATFPFIETFSDTALPNMWERASTTPEGRISIVKTTIDGTNSWGTAVLTLNNSWPIPKVNIPTPNLNELTLSVDLAPESNVYLMFHYSISTIRQWPMPEYFEGQAPATGVAVSSDGQRWYRAFDPSTVTGPWRKRVAIDLDSLKNRFGFKYTANFRIRFQLYSPSNRSYDQFTIDSVTISSPVKYTTILSARGNGSVLQGGRRVFLPGFSQIISAQPGPRAGFAGWRVKSGQASLDNWVTRTTSATAFSDASIEAVFSDSGRIFDVDTAGMMFQPLSHSFIPGGGDEVRFRCTAPAHIKPGISLSGTNGIACQEIICYGTDSTYSTILAKCSGKTAANARKMTLALSADTVPRTCYFSVISTCQEVFSETYFVKLCRISSVTFASDPHGGIDITSFAGVPGDSGYIAAVPQTGYLFTGWRVDSGSCFIGTPESQNTVVRIAGDAIVKATFGPAPSFSFSAGEVKQVVLARRTGSTDSFNLNIMCRENGTIALIMKTRKDAYPSTPFIMNSDSGRNNLAALPNNYLSSETTYSLPLYGCIAGETRSVRIPWPSIGTIAPPCTLTFSTANPVVCSIEASGNGRTEPEGMVETFPQHMLTVRAVPENAEHIFSHWETTSPGECLMIDRWGSCGGFICSGTAKVKAVFIPRTTHPLTFGANRIVTGNTVAKPEIRAQFTAPAAGRYALSVQTSATIRLYANGFSGPYSSTALGSNFQDATVLHAAAAGEVFNLGIVTLADTLPLGALGVQVDSVYHIEMAATPGGSATIAGGAWIAQKKLATLIARASTGYTFSGWQIDSGIAILTNSSLPVTTAAILSDVKLTPLFTKCGPFEIHEGNQNFSARDHYNGLDSTASFLLAFTAKATGWYTIFQQYGIHWSAEPIMLSCFGSDSTFSGKDVVSDFTTGAICFFAEKASRAFFKVRSTRNSNAWNSSAYFGITIAKHAAITVTAPIGGRLFPSPSVFLSQNDTLLLNARPDSGYVFDKWSISGQTAAVSDSHYSQCRVIPAGPITISALFSTPAPVELTSAAQLVRMSRDSVIMKFIPPEKGSYALVLDSIMSNRTTLYGEDSTLSRPVYTDSKSAPIRFFAARQNVPLFFVTSSTATTSSRTPANWRFIASVVPVFECKIVSDIILYPEPSAYTFASPDVPLPISTGYFGYNYAFAGWEIISGRGSIEKPDSSATLLRAESDIIIKAHFTPLATHEVLTTPQSINLAKGCKNTTHLKLAFSADSAGRYALCVEYPDTMSARGILQYYSTDSLRKRVTASIDRIKPTTKIRIAFAASAAGERHYFMLENYNYLPTDYIKVFIENIPASVLPPDTTKPPAPALAWKALNVYGLTEIPFSASGLSPTEPFGISRFSLSPATSGYYSIQVASYPSFVEMDMLQFGSDSTFSATPVITRLAQHTPAVVVYCDGSKQFIAFRRVDATSSTTGIVGVYGVVRFKSQSGSHGNCFPEVDTLVTRETYVSLSARADEGYMFKGWYAVRGSDSIKVSALAQLELRCVSDTNVVALFTPQQVITLTATDSAITPPANRDYRNLTENSMLFRFVPGDTGRYAFICVGQPYMQAVSLFYQHDSTFTSIATSSVYNDSGFHEHVFSVKDPALPCYFRLGCISSPQVTVSVKRGYTVHLAANGQGRAGQQTEIVVPGNGSYRPNIVATPEKGYRLISWHTKQGQITLDDSLKQITRATVLSDGIIEAAFARGRVHEITDTTTGYQFLRDYCTMHPDSGVRFVFTPHDTGLFSVVLPFAAVGQNTYLHYYGNDSVCQKDLALKRVTGSVGDGVINFNVTDTSLRYYFLVYGYSRSDSIDFSIKWAQPCTLTVESADYGTLRSPAKAILPPGATSLIQFLPDTGYRVEYWEVTHGKTSFNDATRQNPVVTITGSCTIRPHLQKCAPLQFTTEMSKFTFETHGYSLPPDRREIKFMYVAPSDDSLTIEYNTYSTCGCGAFNGQVRSTSGIVFSWGSTSLYKSFPLSSGDTLYLSVINQSSMNPLSAYDTLLRGWFDVRMVIKDRATSVSNSRQSGRPALKEQPDLVTITSNPASISGNGCTFITQSAEVNTYSLTILDRVGNLVVHQKGVIPKTASGRPFFTWDLKNKNGRLVAPGTYLAITSLTLRSGQSEKVKSLIGVIR